MADADEPREAGNANPQGNKKYKLKSGPSIVRAFVRFVNRTVRKVDIVWLNYEGIGVKYKTLEPKQSVDVTTYVGHPWIFRDSANGDKMVVQLKEVYEPVGWMQEDGVPPQRRVVSITIPVYTLKEMCLLAMRGMVGHRQVKELDIPGTLKEELLATYANHSKITNHC